MHRSSAGISRMYARPGNDANQPDAHDASSRRVQYRQGTVGQWDNPSRTTPVHNEFYHFSGARLSQNILSRSVKPAQDFNALIKQEIMAGLVRKSDRYGPFYDGKPHSQYANSIKKYTSAVKRPLNRSEQCHLIHLLQNFTITRSWNWRSLTTTLHSLTSAGAFTPHNPMNERVKLTQTALLSTLLDGVRLKCIQKPEARDIDAQGVANLLWAMAKLVDSGLERTPGLKETVNALLPHVHAQKDQFIPQNIANMLWAMAKLADNRQEWTPRLHASVTTLLPHVKAQKAHFKSQEIANLLWAMAKLVDNGQELTPELSEAVAALLPRVNTQKGQFIPQHIANLLWAMAKLADKGQGQTPGLKEAVTALLSHIQVKKNQFIPQGIANLLWATAKLVDNGQERTPELNEAVAALLPRVNAHKANFIPQEIASLLWAMAKLVDNGQEWTPGLNEAVATLLPHVNAQKAHFKSQEIANLLWAMAKLVDNGQKWTPGLNKAVAALLPQVNAPKAQFKSQEIANLLWAMAKLVDNGQELTPELNEAVVAMLPQVNAQKAHFKSKEIANLLWATAKLGELIELNLATSTFESLVYRISKNLQFSQEEISMSLWGIMVCCASLSLDSNANKNNVFEKHMDDLLNRLENTSPDNDEDQSIMFMAASWLGRACPVIPRYQTIMSKSQSDFRDQLQSSIPSLKIEEEKSLNSLPPVDLHLPGHNMVIEVQGPSHYVGGDFKTRNGSTLLKIALLQKSVFEVIEIPTNQLLTKDLMKPYIDQIKIRVNIPPQGHDSVSLKRGWAGAAYVTDEEQLGEQTGKPAKRKKTNSR
ncbi:DUF1601 domain-containing protein [Salinisphaera sp. G21_0]|uniref:DUF1601 domain-containing protein n=1 Tax=Salinisphaera sp. G21_0 TaxID=2821094 RepID=UPI001ADCF000|nr:DUF1601 domain-containing protein [Salinisphaera sp. G21_0]MBO9483996.1 DUF1601 domain-containing protein [Salinisphaera sp. G21_0]